MRKRAKNFKINSGNSAGTYFPVATALSKAISSPRGRECRQDDPKDGPCGVPNLISQSIVSKGSAENVLAIQKGRVQSALAQADVAYWAANSKGIYQISEPYDKLRAIANLYQESAHLVVRIGAGIQKIADLKGKKISLGRKGSGTIVDARLILAAHGLEHTDYTHIEAKPGKAADLLLANELDAFFLVSGSPSAVVSDITRRGVARVIPINEAPVEMIYISHNFFSRGVIPKGTYNNDTDIQTMNVGALWLVSSDIDEELVYQITKALWSPANRKTLDDGHIKGKQITIDTALIGVPILLHPGAERYYVEAGILEAEAPE